MQDKNALQPDDDDDDYDNDQYIHCRLWTIIYYAGPVQVCKTGFFFFNFPV